MTTERSSEISSPYSAQPAATSASAPAASGAQKPFDLDTVKKVRTVHLAQAKATGQKFSMLTCYDALTAQVFDRAGIEMLLVGDSAANVVLGYESTLTITLDEMIPLVAAVSRGASRAMVVADLPFGSYEQSPQQAVASAVRLMKEGGAHAVKIEADASMTEWIRALVRTGIPVVAHVGFTPQSEHALGGFRVQGRGEAAERVLADAVALAEAGAFCVLMEMVTAEVARRVDDADHRYWCFERDDRSGAGLAGHDGPARGPRAALREAVRADRQGHGGRRPRLPRSGAFGRVPGG